MWGGAWWPTSVLLGSLEATRRFQRGVGLAHAAGRVKIQLIKIFNDRRRTSVPYFSSKDRTVLIYTFFRSLFRSNFTRKWRP